MPAQGREQHLAERVDDPHQQRRDERAADRADAADHDDDEADDQHLAAHAGIDRRHRRRDEPRERGEPDPDREDHPIQEADRDAERLHHLAIGCAGADAHAEAGLRHHRPQRERHDAAHGRDEQAVDGVGHHVGQREAAGQPRGHRDAVHLVADEDAAQFLEHEDEPVRHQHLLQVLTLVEIAEEHPLEQVAERHRERHADQQRREEAATHGQAQPTIDQRREGIGEIGAQHVEAAVREIDHAHDPEDQREAGRDEEQQQAVLHGVEALDEEGGEVHRVSVEGDGRRCVDGIPAKAGTRSGWRCEIGSLLRRDDTIGALHARSALLSSCIPVPDRSTP